MDLTTFSIVCNLLSTYLFRLNKNQTILMRKLKYKLQNTIFTMWHVQLHTYTDATCKYCWWELLDWRSI